MSSKETEEIIRMLEPELVTSVGSRRIDHFYFENYSYHSDPKNISLRSNSSMKSETEETSTSTWKGLGVGNFSKNSMRVDDSIVFDRWLASTFWQSK